MKVGCTKINRIIKKLMWFNNFVSMNMMLMVMVMQGREERSSKRSKEENKILNQEKVDQTQTQTHLVLPWPKFCSKLYIYLLLDVLFLSCYLYYIIIESVLYLGFVFNLARLIFMDSIIVLAFYLCSPCPPCFHIE